MQTIEDQILDFTARERGLKSTRVLLNSRLLQDLGMDGDDAVEFFKTFSERFHVDLERLWIHWHHHFGPEGLFRGLAEPEIAITVQNLIDAVQAARWVKSSRGESSV